MQTKLARWSAGADNQEVGLEAATLERVRNSSLVESGGADNVAGIKSATDAMDRSSPASHLRARRSGRGCMVGERRIRRRSRSGSSGGVDTSADAGMSSETHGENP